MSPEKSAALLKDFPRLYKDYHMGFACGNGWEPIIRRLSERLEFLITLCPGEPEEKPRAVQVKQKFAGLRFYMYGGTEDMYKYIREAEDQAIETCELCGEKGSEKTIETGWIWTLCERCSLLDREARIDKLRE